jgi:predicted transcriptional regulator
MRQRITNPNEILKMLAEGKTQKEIASHFGVSPAAICKRLKRLTPPPDTPHFNQLTNKEKRFVIEKVKGKSNIQAVLASHDVTSKESAKSMASQLMSKPDIQMSITELMEHCGIDRHYRIRRLKNIIDSSDLNIAHKGLDMSFKLDGSYAPEKHLNYTISYQDITAEIERLKAEAAGEDSESPARSGD